MVLHGRYEITGAWTVTSHGNCAEGTDTLTGKRVFIKEFQHYRYSDDADKYAELEDNNRQVEAFRDRVERVGSAIRQIASVNGDVVVTTDFFREGNSLYKVNDFVDMESWLPSRVCKHLTSRQVDDLMLRLTNAISALHGANILHCDLKPENVFIVKRDGNYIGMVSDFDDSFFLNEAPDPELVVGTPEFMSPEFGYYKYYHEFWEENRDVLPLTEASDLFSLGLVYHMFLTGEMPKIFSVSAPEGYDPALLKAQEEAAQMWSIFIELEGKPAFGYRLSDKLDAAHYVLIQRLLAPMPADRIASCTALSAEINRIRNAQGEYTIRAMDGDKPMKKKALSLVAAYPSAGGEVREPAQVVRTDGAGIVRLTGVPSGLRLGIQRGEDVVDIVWDADRSFVFQKAAPPEAVRYRLRVRCDGLPAAGQAVTLSRYEDGWKKVSTLATDASGEIVYLDLPEGDYAAGCHGAMLPVKWDADRCFALDLREYAVRATRGRDAAAHMPISLSVVARSARMKVAAGETDADGLFRFRFLRSRFRWSAECDGRREEFVFPEDGVYELKLPGRTQILCRATLAGSTTPVEGVKFALLRREGDRPRTLAEAVTDAGGEAALGRFEPGEYYLAAISAPEGIEPSGGAFRQGARVVVPEGHEKFRLRMEFTRRFIPPEPENIVADRQVPPGRGGRYVRVIHYNDGKVIIVQENGSYRCLRSAGELGLYELSGF